MSKLIVRMKILPEDIDTDLDKLLDSIVSTLPSDIGVKSNMKEPIAFGLNALVIDFSLEDSDGQMERLENIVKGVKGVSEIQVVNLSRISNFKSRE